VTSSVSEKEKRDEQARLEKTFEEFKSGRAKTIKIFKFIWSKSLQ